MHISDKTPLESTWPAVATVGVGAFALVTTEFLPVGLLPNIAADLAITEGQAGLMVTLPGFLAALAAPLTLQWAARLDRRFLLVGLLGLLAISNALVSVADTFWILLVGRVMLGLAVGSFWTIAGTLGFRLRPAQGARATALIFSGVSLGTVAGVPAGTLLGDWLGWRVVFEVAAVTSMLVALALYRLLPSLPSQTQTGAAALFKLMNEPSPRLGLLAVLLVFSGQFAAYTYVAPYLDGLIGLNSQMLSLALLVFGVAGFIGNGLGATLINKGIQTAMAVTLILMAAPMLILAALPSLQLAVSSVVFVLILLWGLGFGLLPMVMQSWLFSLAPTQPETMGAVFVCSAQVSIGIGALGGGLLVDNLGVVTAMAAGGVLAGITLLVLRSHRLNVNQQETKAI
ncbi:MFS transporter [Rheinheimera marina]|uniref:MFS transporter n=1 Tax=Rheinheimera marina TaxID=1774958 RepID=A0ABV9JHL1_9GAMM